MAFHVNVKKIQKIKNTYIKKKVKSLLPQHPLGKIMAIPSIFYAPLLFFMYLCTYVCVYFFSLHCSLKTFFSLLAVLWTSAFSWVYFSLSPLPFTSLLFSDL